MKTRCLVGRSWNSVLPLALALIHFVAAGADLVAPSSPGATILVAARDSSAQSKAAARFVAHDEGDQDAINAAIRALPAAGGTVAADIVAKSPPDGYTMAISFNAPLAFGPHLYANLPYDPLKDLAPVIITSSQPNVLAVNAALPVTSVKALVEYAKARPGKLNYASVGNGSSSHLTMELLKSMAGFDAVHVPFNGSPPAVTATIQNETQMMFAVMAPLQAQIACSNVKLTGNSNTYINYDPCVVYTPLTMPSLQLTK